MKSAISTTIKSLCAAACILASVTVTAQQRKVPGKVPEPTTPVARTFHDARYHVRFQIPAGWNFTQKDGELSTFHLDARSAPRKAQLRAVANISFNPYPIATFSGALFYFSVEPHATEAECTAQAAGKIPPQQTHINGVTFTQGHDEHGTICVDARDEVYTTRRAGACYRFDLAMNTFCGGEVSGVKDMTQPEMDNIRQRMESILNTITFDPK